MEGDGETERGAERGLTDKQQANKQEVQWRDGVTMSDLLLRGYQMLLLPIKCSFYGAVCRCHTHTAEQEYVCSIIS